MLKPLTNLIIKKSYIFTIIAGCSIFALCGSNSAYAVDITAGATSWCAWGEQKSSGADNDAVMKSDPALLFGPTLSVKLGDNFNITFVYLYGRFNFKDKDDVYPKFRSKRSDADLTLNYRLNDYFKVFAGIKYLSFDMRPVRYNSKIGGLLYYSENEGKHRFFSGGLGLTATFSITNNLFLFATLSGFSGWGTEKVNVISETTGLKKDSFDVGINDLGVNSNLSLAYYITSASTIISLGVRYQYFKTKYDEDKFFPVTIDNTIYGITLSAAYSFDI